MTTSELNSFHHKARQGTVVIVTDFHTPLFINVRCIYWWFVVEIPAIISGILAAQLIVALLQLNVHVDCVVNDNIMLLCFFSQFCLHIRLGCHGNSIIYSLFLCCVSRLVRSFL